MERSGGDRDPGPDLEPTPIASSPELTADEPLPEDPPPEQTPDPPADPPKEKPEQIAGVVVQSDSVARSYSVASGAGALSTIHPRDLDGELPEIGDAVRVPVEALLNTTYAEAGDRQVRGSRRQATFTGTVTYLDRPGSRYVVSSPGASVVVAAPLVPGSEPELPPLTSSVTVRVALEVQKPKDAADRAGSTATAGAPKSGEPSARRPSSTSRGASPTAPIPGSRSSRPRCCDRWSSQLSSSRSATRRSTASSRRSVSRSAGSSSPRTT